MLRCDCRTRLKCCCDWVILASLSLAPWWFRELDSIAAAYEPFGQRNKFQTILYEVIGVAPDLLCVSGVGESLQIPTEAPSIKPNCILGRCSNSYRVCEEAAQERDFPKTPLA